MEGVKEWGRGDRRRFREHRGGDPTYRQGPSRDHSPRLSRAAWDLLLTPLTAFCGDGDGCPSHVPCSALMTTSGRPAITASWYWACRAGRHCWVQLFGFPSGNPEPKTWPESHTGEWQSPPGIQKVPAKLRPHPRRKDTNLPERLMTGQGGQGPMSLLSWNVTVSSPSPTVLARVCSKPGSCGMMGNSSQLQHQGQKSKKGPPKVS